MNESNNSISKIDETLLAQRRYFDGGETLSVKFRLGMLKKLKNAILENEDGICEALYKDLGKSKNEAYMCEVGMALAEISYMIKHLRRFARPSKVRTPLAQFPAKSYTLPCPYGNTLIMSPWNYPFLLTVGPLVDAIAAGNTAIIKPSAYSPTTSKLLKELITDIFPTEYVAVITGGREENKRLLDMKFDFVFFTGSQAVGKEVLRHTAEHLTPVVLELGGKSPCIVDASANIPLAAKRIIFGKLLNCGQTCVAPDYVLAEKSIKDKLIAEIKQQITLQYGTEPLKNPDYGRIVNKKHFDRLVGLIDKEKLVIGGEFDKEALRLASTVLDGVSFSDKAMQEEIFGPILPILTFDSFDEVYPMLKELPKPLAFYLFSEDKRHVKELTERCRFGGGCVNDVIIHLATTEMGFGGVGESGMGAYHGKVGFETFSHRKSIVSKSTRLDLPMRYQPYKKGFMRLVRLFLR